MHNLTRLSGLMLAVFLGASAAYARIERKVEKQFTVSAAGTIDLSTQGGSIAVETIAGSVAKITAIEKIRADSDSEADEVLKRLTLTIDLKGNDITAVAKLDVDDSSWTKGWHWGSSSSPLEVDFVVQVPANFAGKLQTSGGSIKVGDLAGSVIAHTSGGRIDLGKLGGVVDASTSGGNITLDSAVGDTKLKTSGGNITAGHIGGTAVLETSGGNVALDRGDKSIRAVTSGGNVRVVFAGPLGGDSELRSSGGRVSATVAKNAAFTLDASTSGGSVHAEGISITLSNGGQGKTRLSGDVNGGGPKLLLRTSGGNVELKTAG